MDDAMAIASERPSAERRCKQVLDAAERCVQRLGFHNASMAEIATAAGMSVGHIYRYFPSKEAIIVAIVQRDCAQAMSETEALERDPRCLHSALIAHTRRVIERLAKPDHVAMVLEVMAEAARNPRVAEVVRTGFEDVRDRMLAVVERGYAPGMSQQASRRAMDVLDLIMGGLAMKAVKTPDFDREAMSALAVECIEIMIGEAAGDMPGGKAQGRSIV